MSLNLQKNWQNYNSRIISKPVGVQLARLSALKEYGRSFKVFTSKTAEKANCPKKSRIFKNLA